MILSIIANLNIGGAILLFLWVFAGSLGIPGGAIIMIAYGSLAESVSKLILFMMISFVAAVIGDILAYELARRLSNKLRDKLRKFLFFRNNEPKVRSLLNKYGFYIIFFTRFALVNLCAVTSYVSGLEKVNRKKFIFAVISGELLFAIIYPLIGYTLGEIFSNLINAINYFVVGILLLILIIYLIRSNFYKKSKY
ncbi:MAG: VTT domain-containing protein [Candidatus Woesearchaeota archaeon]